MVVDGPEIALLAEHVRLVPERGGRGYLALAQAFDAFHELRRSHRGGEGGRSVQVLVGSIPVFHAPASDEDVRDLEVRAGEKRRGSEPLIHLYRGPAMVLGLVPRLGLRGQ